LFAALGGLKVLADNCLPGFHNKNDVMVLVLKNVLETIPVDIF